MTTRPAPWQRNMIALAWGITLKASGSMRWTANVTALGARPQDVRIFGIDSIVADNEGDAARIAAERSAKRFYGDEGMAGFINETHRPLYTVTVGLYNNGTMRGRSLEILMLRYTHPVTGK